MHQSIRRPVLVGASTPCTILIALSLAAASAILPAPVAAEPRGLTGPEIRQILADAEFQAVDGKWRQVFASDGVTTYYARRADGEVVSGGRWTVRGDQYCSIWPPAGRWDCYDVTYDAHDMEIVWISGGGERSAARRTGR